MFNSENQHFSYEKNVFLCNLEKFFFPNGYLGSSKVFSPDCLRCDLVQLQRQAPGKVPVQRLGEVPEGSGRRYVGQVPQGSGADAEVKLLGEVPEGCGADAEVRFRKVPVQWLGEVPEGSGADLR